MLPCERTSPELPPDPRPSMCALPPRQVYRRMLWAGPEVAASVTAWCIGVPLSAPSKGTLTRIPWTLRELEHLAALVAWSRAGRVPS